MSKKSGMDVNVVSAADGEFMYKPSYTFALYNNFPPCWFSFIVFVFRRVLNGHNLDIYNVLCWCDFVTCLIGTWNISCCLF
jgi:hypothetical protein